MFSLCLSRMIYSLWQLHRCIVNELSVSEWLLNLLGWNSWERLTLFDTSKINVFTAEGKSTEKKLFNGIYRYLLKRQKIAQYSTLLSQRGDPLLTRLPWKVLVLGSLCNEQLYELLRSGWKFLTLEKSFWRRLFTYFQCICYKIFIGSLDNRM